MAALDAREDTEVAREAQRAVRLAAGMEATERARRGRAGSIAALSRRCRSHRVLQLWHRLALFICTAAFHCACYRSRSRAGGN